MKAREHNSPIIQELIDETTPEEMEKINKEMTKTAVEWLIEQIEKGKIEIVYSDKIHSIKCIPEIIQQAKEMEKEQIKKAWVDGNYNTDDDGNPSENYSISDEHYINTTYGGKK
jgi:HEPN domain-containing protein